MPLSSFFGRHSKPRASEMEWKDQEAAVLVQGAPVLRSGTSQPVRQQMLLYRIADKKCVLW